MNIYTGARYPVHRFECEAVRADVSGSIEAMSLWAGESVGVVSRVQPAGEIVREVVDAAERRLRRWR